MQCTMREFTTYSTNLSLWNICGWSLVLMKTNTTTFLEEQREFLSLRPVTNLGRCRIRWVSDLLDENDAWNQTLVRQTFLPVDCDAILRIRTSPHDAPDLLGSRRNLESSLLEAHTTWVLIQFNNFPLVGHRVLVQTGLIRAGIGFGSVVRLQRSRFSRGRQPAMPWPLKKISDVGAWAWLAFALSVSWKLKTSLLCLWLRIIPAPADTSTTCKSLYPKKKCQITPEKKGSTFAAHICQCGTCGAPGKSLLPKKKILNWMRIHVRRTEEVCTAMDLVAWEK